MLASHAIAKLPDAAAGSSICEDEYSSRGSQSI
jgi:hypothetical protein